jgi:hypothetical protein
MDWFWNGGVQVLFVAGLVWVAILIGIKAGRKD